MRTSSILALLVLTACSAEPRQSREMPPALNLRGTEITLAREGVLPDDSIGFETFLCNGEWSGRGRVAVAGTYRIEGDQVCVTQAGFEDSQCRAFHFQAPGELYVRDPGIDAWIEYRAFDRGEC